MKKSKSPSIRIKRAVKELREQNNRFDIGNTIFEEIILKGIAQQKMAIAEAKKQYSNHISSPKLLEEAMLIV